MLHCTTDVTVNLALSNQHMTMFAVPKPTHHLNMHQTMTEKVKHDR
jgi:hypothetical protein